MLRSTDFPPDFEKRSSPLELHAYQRTIKNPVETKVNFRRVTSDGRCTFEEARKKERTLGESIEDRDRRYSGNDPERHGDSDLRSTQRCNSLIVSSFRSVSRILSRYRSSLNHRVIVSRSDFYSTGERGRERITRSIAPKSE